MINHCFRLLLNESTRDLKVALSNDNYYIDPSFTKINIPDELMLILNAIYGSNPDIYGKIYKTHQLLTIIALSPYNNFLFQFDPRTTIEFTENVPLEMPALGIRILGDLTHKPQILDEYTDAYGRMFTYWRVTILDTTISIKNIITNESITKPTTELPCILPGSSLRITFTHGIPNTGTWLIQATTIPYPSLQQLYNILPTLNLNYLFNGDYPFSLFSKIYNDSTLPTHRLIGAVLAVIFRLEQIRTGGS